MGGGVFLPENAGAGQNAATPAFMRRLVNAAQFIFCGASWAAMFFSKVQARAKTQPPGLETKPDKIRAIHILRHGAPPGCSLFGRFYESRPQICRAPALVLPESSPICRCRPHLKIVWRGLNIAALLERPLLICVGLLKMPKDQLRTTRKEWYNLHKQKKVCCIILNQTARRPA